MLITSCFGESRGPNSNADQAPAFAGARFPSGDRGFTLVELMVVLVILGLLATVVVFNVLPALSKGTTEKAKIDISTLDQGLEMYKLQNLRYPDPGEGLQALVDKGVIKKLPKDPWGRPYRYAMPGQHGDADIYSLGADGAEGGEGENADIGNWQ